MREHARQQTAMLLRRLAFQITRAARPADADCIHDLRVAIRRLSRCLRVFAQYYPDDTWKKLRKRLRRLMRAAGNVRDRDIALELAEKAGLSRKSVLMKRLREERRDAARELRLALGRWKTRNSSRKWRTALEL